MKVKNEMPAISSCMATKCAYNVNKKCHARAITVGDDQTPGCDTFLAAKQHNKEIRRIAGVGACKVTSCKFNEDYECSAENILVGYNEANVRCLTYTINT